ncbi:MAG: helix-hairpin-helix domain-containing protein [Chloroflexota bacterium]
MPAQEKLTPTEQNFAYLIGLGIAITIVALLLIGLGTIDNADITTSLLIVGIALIVLGVGGWLIMVRPWERFDDLKTPHYAGHDTHAPAEEAAPIAKAKAAPVAEVKAAPVTEAKAAPAEEAAPAPAAPAAPDDLTLIEGIGPKSAAALNESGITTFAQVAAMTAEQLEQAVKERGVRLVGNAANWPKQAALAAAGDFAALAELQAKLKGGV